MHWCARLKTGASALLLVLALTPARAQIIVGVSTPMNTSFGKEVADGARLAAEEVNERGGVLGKKIELITADDACNPPQAVALAQRLIEFDKAAAVIGYPCAGAALAARDVFTRSKTLMIALASAPALTTGKDSQFVLRPIGREDRLAAAAAAYLKANFNGKKVGALLSESRFGIGALLLAASKVQFPLQSVETVKPDSPKPGWVNSVDALVAAGVAPEFIDRILREQSGLSAVLVTNVVSEQNSTLLAASKRAVAIANPNASFFPGAKPAVESGKKRNLATGGYFIYAYAGIQIFANLANKAGSVSGDALAALARKEPVPSLLGPLRFDDLGDPIGWQFALFSGGPEGSVKPLEPSAVDLCKTDQCSQLDYCSKPCPNN
jgi:branched-chain amino acid transport system substrate-binding protein